jgi:hypothetical protein
MNGGVSRLARQLTELLAELLLEVVCKLILSAEEDDTTLRDCDVVNFNIREGGHTGKVRKHGRKLALAIIV